MQIGTSSSESNGNGGAILPYTFWKKDLLSRIEKEFHSFTTRKADHYAENRMVQDLSRSATATAISLIHHQGRSRSVLLLWVVIYSPERIDFFHPRPHSVIISPPLRCVSCEVREPRRRQNLLSKRRSLVMLARMYRFDWALTSRKC